LRCLITKRVLRLLGALLLYFFSTDGDSASLGVQELCLVVVDLRDGGGVLLFVASGGA